MIAGNEEPALDLVIAALEKIREKSDARHAHRELRSRDCKRSSCRPRSLREACASPTERRLQSAPNKAELLEPIRERVRACTKCAHLACSRTQTVFGVGNPDADLMFIGEAPGADEDQQGEPFVGRAGQLLTKIIKAMSFAREDVYIANILKCRPDMPPGSFGNRPPTPTEMQTCRPYLVEQIDIIQPRVLVALGAVAVEGLLGTRGTMRELRGRWHAYNGIPLMITYHPAYLLRNQSPSEKRKVWEDMLQVTGATRATDHRATAKLFPVAALYLRRIVYVVSRRSQTALQFCPFKYRVDRSARCERDSQRQNHFAHFAARELSPCAATPSCPAASKSASVRAPISAGKTVAARTRRFSIAREYCIPPSSQVFALSSQSDRSAGNAPVRKGFAMRSDAPR